jgi:hypothetical protein
MAKLPPYMKVTEDYLNMKYIVKIKYWGLPIILFKTLKDDYELKWYQWIFYLWLLFKFFISTKKDGD